MSVYSESACMTVYMRDAGGRVNRKGLVLNLTGPPLTVLFLWHSTHCGFSPAHRMAAAAWRTLKPLILLFLNVTHSEGPLRYGDFVTLNFAFLTLQVLTMNDTLLPQYCYHSTTIRWSRTLNYVHGLLWDLMTLTFDLLTLEWYTQLNSTQIY